MVTTSAPKPTPPAASLSYEKDLLRRRGPQTTRGGQKQPSAACSTYLARWRRGAAPQTPVRAEGARDGPECLLGPPRGPATARGLARATAAHRDRPRTPSARLLAHRSSESSRPRRRRAVAHTRPSPQVQLFLSAEGRTSTLDVDGALTVGQLKDVIEDESFIPADLQRLSAGGRDLTTGTLEDNELADGTSIELLLNVAGGGEASRYKKSTSKMRWKWKKKRTRRLQRKRRKMRARAK